MFRYGYFACLGMLASALLAANTARAELDIIITQGTARVAPIAVVPFGWSGQSARPPVDISGVVGADLKRSGRFGPIPEKDMLQKPTAGVDVDFDDWGILGVEVVVIGQVEQTAENGFTLQFQVFDVFQRRQLLGYRMTATRSNLREAAHRAADMIFEKLTGIKGVFATRIAYITATGQGANKTYALVVADADGENEHIIVESPEPIMSPSWSPDNRKLAYVSFEGGVSSIFVQTLRTGNRIKVSAKPGINGAPSFSPDGRRLVLTLGGEDGNPDIHILDLNTKELTRLTTSRAIDTEGTWSPDGREIYFTSDRSGGPQIYKVSADGGKAERVTFEGSYNARPRLSPDGKKVALVHNDRGNYRIGVLDLENRNLLILTNGRLDESPSFAANGDTLIYATRRGADGVLATVSVDGQIRQELTSGIAEVREPVWSGFPPN